MWQEEQGLMPACFSPSPQLLVSHVQSVFSQCIHSSLVTLPHWVWSVLAEEILGEERWLPGSQEAYRQSSATHSRGMTQWVSLWLEANPSVSGFSFPVWLLSVFPWHHLTSLHCIYTWLLTFSHTFNWCLCLNGSCFAQSTEERLTCFP